VNAAYRSSLVLPLLGSARTPQPRHAIVARAPGWTLTLCCIAVLATLPLAAQSGRAPGPAPRRFEIAGGATCKGCRIAIEHVVALGDSDGPGAIAEYVYAIQRDSRGRFYTVGGNGDDRIPAVYDASGRFLQRLGRVGRGPGEFLGAAAMLLLRDSIYIFDQGNARLAVLSPQYQPVRTAPIPRSTLTATFAGDSTLILNAEVNDRERIGLPFHRFDIAGNYVASFGDPTTRPSPRSPAPVFRLARANGGGFWAAPATGEYRIEKWGAQGVKHFEVHRRVAWFEPYQKAWAPTPDRPPPPTISALWEDGEGLLWVISAVGDPNWQQGLGAGRRGEGGQTYYPWLDHSRLFDSMVEVIDPRAGVVLASQRLDVALWISIGDGLFSSLDERADGSPRHDVWRLRLARP